MKDVILKRFESPDEVRVFEKGRFEIAHLGSLALGKATYEPGWKWSVHIGKAAGSRCSVEHVGLVLSGKAAVSFENREVLELTPGTLFYIPAVPHDSWVIGDQIYVSIHLVGSDHYAKHPAQQR
jgi:uncharacterized RmlC-like cupin family protein